MIAYSDCNYQCSINSESPLGFLELRCIIVIRPHIDYLSNKVMKILFYSKRFQGIV
jgi:hypothetical protein